MVREAQLQFIDPGRGSVAVQSLVLGTTQIVIALSVIALSVSRPAPAG